MMTDLAVTHFPEVTTNILKMPSFVVFFCSATTKLYETLAKWERGV